MPRYLYQRPNSPNFWFEIKIPKDVQSRLGRTRVRRTTNTDSLKKAQRLAFIWAGEIWDQVEKARSPDWDNHKLELAVQYERDAGLTDDEIYDLGLDIVEPDEVQTLRVATNQTVRLIDHLGAYLQWSTDKGNLPKTIETKQVMLGQFCRRFTTLDDVTEREVMRWAAEHKLSGSSQKSMKSFAKDFYKYLGTEVLFINLNLGVLEGLKNKEVNSKPKDVIDGSLFKKLLNTNPNTDALMLLAHTGRRSVAMANLECRDVVERDGVPCFSFAVDKGRRRDTHVPQIVPIHTRLLPIVERLLKDSKDGFLLPLVKMDVDGRSENLQSLVSGHGSVTAHQFRTSVITMLHNSPEGLADKFVYAVVGHDLGKDPHKKRYLRGLKSSVLVAAVEAINWDTWKWE